MGIRLKLAAAAIALVILLPLLLLPLGGDQQIFTYMGWALLHGKVPLVDTWDNTVPGAVVWHSAATAIGGPSDLAVRACDLAWQVLTGVLIACLAFTIGGAEAALLSVVLYAGPYMQAGHWHTAQKDGFAATLLLGAALMVVAATGRARLLNLLGAGLLAGGALTMKWVFLPHLALLSLAVLLLGRRTARSRWQAFGDAATVLGAAGAVVAAMIAPYALTGHLRDFYETTVMYNRDLYGGMGAKGLWMAPITISRHAPILLLGAGLALLHPGVRSVAGHRVLLVLGMLLAATVAAIAVQGKYFEYYFLPYYAFLAPLAGVGITGAVLALAGEGRRRLVAPGVAALAVLTLLTHPEGLFTLRGFSAAGSLQRYYDDPLFATWGGADLKYSDRTAAADWLRARTRPDEAIQIWGVEPYLYVQAGRLAATRFQTNHGLVTEVAGKPRPPFQEAWRQQFLDQLRERAPRYFVVVDRDKVWWVPGSPSSTQLLARWHQLKALVDERYRKVETIGRFAIYELDVRQP